MPSRASSETQAKASTTRRFTLVLVWILASAFNYGFGISELNPLQPILTCHASQAPPPSSDPSLQQPSSLLSSPPTSGCIPLTEQQFGLITSLFTLGGLVSSFAVSPLATSLGWGRSRCITLSALFGLLGSVLLASAHSLVSLAAGRFVQGIGSGIGVVVVPIYINEISPTSLQGSNGVLNQLAIVVGIFAAQAIGASPLGQSGTAWRWVPATAALVSLVQLATGLLFGVESPGWLQAQRTGADALQQAEEVRRLLWSAKEVERHRDAARTAPADATEADERQGLLADDQPDVNISRSRPTSTDQDTQQQSAGLLRIFTDASIRPGALMVVFTQLAQQLSGVNAVLYYSTGILSTILPSLAGSIGILITIINMLMTFPPILLIHEDRLGRRNLLLLSAGAMSVSSFVLGLAIVYGWKALSAICIVVMVAAFSVGLGPVPFVILPELVPTRAVSAATSLGLTLNWTANFLVGSAFLPLKNWLATLDADHTGGGVFWIFTVTNLVSALVLARFYVYRPQTNLAL